ncbi:MAG: hypothetical protein GXY82_04880 [Methanospirillum sp.]|nr:hypothetical protein [Methanospirillum sp.]
MKNNDVPCCTAGAVLGIKPVEVNGATVGLSMLDLVFAEVWALELADSAAVRAELVRRVKVFTYVPPAAADACAAAVHREYERWNQGGK